MANHAFVSRECGRIDRHPRRRSDARPAGSDVGFGGNEQTNDGLVVNGHVAFFAANNGVNGFELYRLDLSELRDVIFTRGFED